MIQDIRRINQLTVISSDTGHPRNTCIVLPHMATKTQSVLHN